MERTLTPQPFADRRLAIMALLLGAIAAGLIVAYLATRDSASEPEPATPMVSVVVAAQQIPAGKKIEEADIAFRSLPMTAVVDGTFREKDSALGETARYPIPQGEQIGPSRLVSTAPQRALSFQIPPGLRGVTIPVDVDKAPAGLAVPGDFVDVLVTADLQLVELPGAVATVKSDDDLKAVVTILQNVQVLSVSRDYVDNGVPYDSSVRGKAPEDDDIDYVTLAVTPEQAQLLFLAITEGTVTLALRAFGDDSTIDLAPIAEPVRLQ